MSKKNYKAIVETYKYDVVYESNEFDETKEVLGEYSSKEEARKKIQEWFDGLVSEFEGCEEGEDYRIEQDENGCWMWDYTESDGEGYVKKYCCYVDYKRDYKFKIKTADDPAEYYETEEEYRKGLDMLTRTEEKWFGELKGWKKVSGKWVLIHEEEWERAADGGWKNVKMFDEK